MSKTDKNNDASYEELHRLFSYHPTTGFLIRKILVSGISKTDIVAGSLSPYGYLRVTINGKSYPVHRIIWCMYYGYWPENDLDHINKNKADNRIENLREVSRQCNLRNSGNLKSNTSGVKGVHWRKQRQRWQARITVNDKRIVLGSYKDFNQAVIERFRAELIYDWHSCDTLSPAHEYLIENNLMNKVIPT